MLLVHEGVESFVLFSNLRTLFSLDLGSIRHLTLELILNLPYFSSNLSSHPFHPRVCQNFLQRRSLLRLKLQNFHDQAFEIFAKIGAKLVVP